MIYSIYLDGNALYYAGDRECTLTAAKWTQALNDAGTLEITIPPTNPLYSSVYERKSKIELRRDDVAVWAGEVREVSYNIRKEKTAYCVGELSYLADSVQPQKQFTNYTPRQFFEELLDVHNAQVEAVKRFNIGAVTVTDPNDSIYRYTNFDDTLGDIKEKLCDTLDGFLKIRHVGGFRYIDLLKLEDYGRAATQAITFGENLLKYTNSVTTDDLCTALIPLGAELDEESVANLPNYTNITSVNGGRNYITSPAAVNNFGYIWRVVNFDGVTEPANLLKKAQNYLAGAQYADLEITVDAVDLAALNANITAFDLGDSVRCIAEPFGLDAWFYITELEIDLLNPAKNTITIGNKVKKKSLTEQNAAKLAEIEERIPSTTTLLESAKANATELITNANTGYVTTSLDASGNPYEILIMNAPDKTQATKLWRWNLGGLGYSKKGYNGPYGTAITMDGAIVADFITAGTLDASRANVTNLNASNITTGTIDASRITVRNINASNINAGTLDAARVNVTNLNASNITSGEIDANRITVRNVTAKDIQAGAVITNSFTCTALTATGANIQGNISADSGTFNNVEITGSCTVAGAAVSAGINASNVTYGSLAGGLVGSGINGYNVTAGAVQSGYISSNLHGKTLSTTYLESAANYITSYSTGIGIYGYVHVGPSGGGANFSTNTYIAGSLNVEGSKNRVIKTEDFGTVALSAYETPVPYFADLGEGELDESGVLYIPIDEEFQEVTEKTRYIAKATPYGPGAVYFDCASSSKSMAVFRGTPGLAFSFEIVNVQKGMQGRRYEVLEFETEPENTTYEAESDQLLAEYMKEEEE